MSIFSLLFSLNRAALILFSLLFFFRWWVIFHWLSISILFSIFLLSLIF